MEKIVIHCAQKKLINHFTEIIIKKELSYMHSIEGHGCNKFNRK